MEGPSMARFTLSLVLALTAVAAGPGDTDAGAGYEPSDTSGITNFAISWTAPTVTLTWKVTIPEEDVDVFEGKWLHGAAVTEENWDSATDIPGPAPTTITSEGMYEWSFAFAPQDGTTYFALRIVTKDGSRMTVSPNVTLTHEALPSVDGLVAAPVAADAVIVSWNAPTHPDVAEVQVVCSSDATMTEVVSQSAWMSDSVTSYIFPGLPFGTYYIAAKTRTADQSMLSEFSTPVGVTLSPPPGAAAGGGDGGGGGCSSSAEAPALAFLVAAALLVLRRA